MQRPRKGRRRKRTTEERGTAVGSWVAGMTVRTGGNKEKYICGKHGGDGEKQENLFIVAVFAERVCSDAVKVIQAWQQPSPLRFSTEETVAGKKLRSLEANLQTLRACQTEEAAAPNKIFFFSCKVMRLVAVFPRATLTTCCMVVPGIINCIC